MSWKRNKKCVKGLVVAVSVMAILSGCSVGKSTKITKTKSGEITNNSIVMTVGKEKVNYREVKDYAYLLNCQYRAGFGEDVWKYQISKSKTIGEEAKQEIISMITQLKVISMAAQNQKITLTADEEDEALQQAEKVMKKASEADIAKYSLNTQDLSDIYKENILAEKMFYVATDEIGTDVPTEDARQMKIQYFYVMTNGTNRDGRKISMTQEEVDKTKKTMATLRKEAKKATSFEDFAKLHSDDEQCETLIGKGDSDWDEDVLQKILTLKKSEISPVLEGKNGFYVVKCLKENDEDATYAKKEEIIKEKQTNLFKEKYGEWLSGKKTNINDEFWKKFSI